MCSLSKLFFLVPWEEKLVCITLLLPHHVKQGEEKSPFFFLEREKIKNTGQPPLPLTNLTEDEFLRQDLGV